MRLLYSLLLLLATPLILTRLAWRGLHQRGYWQHWGERFGRFPAPTLARAIWLHAVSVGEMRATQPLVRLLQTSFPGRPILLTCMTPTGRETARELYGESLRCVYLPYDFAIFHRRFIAHFDPAVLLVMETEIWPNLLAVCHRQGVAAALVNARMSAKSHRGYARFAPVRALAYEALRSLPVVAAQSTADAERLADLGANNPVITGNIKFDLSIDTAQAARGEEWRGRLMPRRKVLLAASTRDGEEAMLLDAYARVFTAEQRRSTLLVVVPRHPQRFDAVASLIRASGLVAGRRSGGEIPAPSCEVWLGDSMGEMAAYVAMCDLAFIGGSLLPLGGQNLIEACAQGKPVIMGPSTFNFAEAARLAREAGALRQVGDAEAAMRTAQALLSDDDARLAMSRAASAFARAHAGATKRTMALIAPLLGAAPAAADDGAISPATGLPRPDRRPGAAPPPT